MEIVNSRWSEFAIPPKLKEKLQICVLMAHFRWNRSNSEETSKFFFSVLEMRKWAKLAKNGNFRTQNRRFSSKLLPIHKETHQNQRRAAG